jgi:hypothetical protein
MAAMSAQLLQRKCAQPRLGGMGGLGRRRAGHAFHRSHWLNRLQRRPFQPIEKALENAARCNIIKEQQVRCL